MKIRRAVFDDLEKINKLLKQVLEIHHSIRPDIFKGNVKKYTDEELLEIIADSKRPIFVADDDGDVIGYAFCIFQEHKNNNILTDIKTLYIDDLCVDENIRGKSVGKSLYQYILEFAKESDCYNVTLNVWSGNDSALRFYEKMGLTPQKVGMEKIL